MNRNFRIAAAVLIAALVAVPMFAARGSADFTRFVALGDSYGAGFENASLNGRHQVWSWPAVIARQAGLSICQPGATATDNCFAIPLVSDPGIPGELQLQTLTGVITPAPGQGTPLMTTFGRPYNNLAVPGATVGALLTVNGTETPTQGEPTVVSYGRFILRGLGTEVQQAVALHPTFIALWIGGNDYLNTAFSGTPATLTSAADFKTRYEAILDTLIAGAPNAGFVVGNLPAPATLVPYLTLVPPVLVDPNTRQPILIGGNPIPFIAVLDDGSVGVLPAGTLIPLQTRDKIAQGYGLPPQLKAIPPFSSLPHTGEPLSPNDIITPTELATIISRVGEYNAIITNAAAQRNIPVADIKGLFDRVGAGMQLGPINVNGSFVTGGFYGLDGFHLTDLGYLLFGDEFIKTINAAYGTEIPLASISQLFADNGGSFGVDSNATVNDISTDAVNQIKQIWTAPAARRRATSH